jgi:hypothetical protein
MGDTDDKSIEIWKIKKLVKSLAAARGYAPPRARGASSAARSLWADRARRSAASCGPGDARGGAHGGTRPHLP